MIRVLPIFALMACQAPDAGGAFNQLELFIAETPDEANQQFADFVGQASDTVQVALPTDQDSVIAEAILDAWNKGLDVEVVTDIDEASQPGIQLLLDNEVPVTLADDGLAYFDFNINADVEFTSDTTIMSNAWVVVDGARALLGTRAGFVTTGETILVEISGEQPVEDIQSEHLQLFGGSDATATTAFDALAKSIADVRWRYATQSDLDLEIWFGPQERLTKRLIDAIYTARGSVHVLTNDLSDDGFARALQDKAEWGFPVFAVVGSEYNRGDSRPESVFQNETPAVENKRRYTGADDMPTLLIVDYDNGIDGKTYNTHAYIVTHDVHVTSRITAAIAPPPFSEEPWIGPVTDQLIDGTLLVIHDYDEKNAEIEALFELWQRHYDNAGAL